MIEGGPPSERYNAPDEGARPAANQRAEYRAEAPVDTEGIVAEQRGEASGTFPWPPAEGVSIFGAFAQTWQGATFQPTVFFRAMSPRGSLGNALLYYLPLVIFVAGAELFWKMVRSGAEQDTGTTLATGGMPLHPIVWFLLSPLMQLVSLFLSAAVTHALLKLFRGASHDYSMTTRIFAFAYSPMIFSVVPVAGPIIGFVWVCVVAIIGVREAQRTSTGRAAAAVLIPVIFALLMLGLAYLLRAAGTLLETPV